MAFAEMDGATASDDVLVAGAQRGDERAFESLYRRYRPDIKGLCSRSLSDSHIAEDVTQETFLRAFRHIGEFERGRPVWPWLATIAKRLCVDERRGTTRRAALGRSVLHDIAGAYDSTSDEALTRVDRQRLRRVVSGALATLRPRDRNVFVLQTIEGWSQEEIAQHHGMSVHAVRNLAWRARRALRRSLGNERTWNWSWLLPVWGRPGERDATRSLRWRLRSWMNTHLEAVAVERAAAIVLGLAAASATILGPNAPTQPRHGAAVEMVREGAAGEATVVSSRASAETREPGSYRAPSRPSVVAASLSLAERDDGAAAPSAAGTRLEVTTPDGRTAVWYELDVECGGQGRTVLPQSGPVKVAC